MPKMASFQPVGLPRTEQEEVVLSVEEVETLRLRELEGLDQEQCAQRMRVSRATFGRMLESARKKLANAVVLGKGIRIEGGNFRLAWQRFRCLEFGHEWDISFDKAIAEDKIKCPDCSSTNVQSVDPPTQA
jgi:predicted DNA-binding protein (UPF0251 family)